jgi:hypothetical protein
MWNKGECFFFTVVVYLGFSVLFRTMLWKLQQFKKTFLQFLLSECCSLLLSWSVRCNETFTICISWVINWTLSWFSSATEVRYLLKPTRSKVITYALTHPFTSLTNFNVRLKGPYMFYWMFLQLIYLPTFGNWGADFCFCICIVSSPPISLRAVSIYFCFASMKALGFLILGKMNVGFSKNINSICHGQPVGRYFRVSIVEWKQKTVRTFRSTSDFFICWSCVWVNCDEHLSSVKMEMTSVMKIFSSTQFSVMDRNIKL